MSATCWGDQFYGINRIEHSELFDEVKEREIILQSLYNNWEKEYYKEAISKDFSFGCLSELEIENNAYEAADFLNDTDITIYYEDAENCEILFFGIHYSLPWQIKEIETQEEIDIRIYNAIKPILKDNITFDMVEPLIKKVVFNGMDAYVTYHEF